MKLNLLIDDKEGVLPGYTNADPFAEESPVEGDSRVRADISNLSPLVDAGECEAVRAMGVLDYTPSTMVDAVLSHWMSLVKFGGTLTLSLTDLKEVARAVNNGSLSVENANAILYGSQRRVWDYKKVAVTMAMVREVAATKGFSTESAFVRDYRAVLVLRRKGSKDV